MIYIDPTQNGFFQGFAKFIKHEYGEPCEITADYTKVGTWILNWLSFKNGIHRVVTENGGDYIAIQTEDKHRLENKAYMDFLNGAIKVYHYFENLHIGYSDSYRLINEESKDIDVLFYGYINDYRSVVLDKIKNLTIAHNVFGNDLQNMINRSKIVVSCHCYKDNDWDWDRIPQLICNKQFFIAEKYFDKTFNDNWSKYIVLTDREKIPELCEYYLNNPIERLKVVDKAFDYMKNEYPSKFIKHDK